MSVLTNSRCFPLRRWAQVLILSGTLFGLVVGCSSSDDDSAVQAPTVEFEYGVASGDPAADGVILWTRVTPLDNQTETVQVRWEVARSTDESMNNVVRSGSFTSSAASDFTVKIDVDGLDPQTPYTYRFSAGGAQSVVGHTQTLPEPDADLSELKFAVFSCANLPKGYFHAYAHAAQEAREFGDLDAVIHLGDYFYEYDASGYPSLVGRDGDNTAESLFSPNKELITLEDYRLRHGQYKQDKDLQELHRLVPFIPVWDDHESANDAWRDGAENHNEGEGLWTDRKAAALQAYHEWMPIRTYTDSNGAEQRERIYRSFDYGNLASLIMLDTRLTGRDEQIDQVSLLLENHDESAFLDNGSPINPYDNFAAYATGAGTLSYAPQFFQLMTAKAAVDAAVDDANRSLLGSTQEAWLSTEVQRSVDRGETWQIFGQQVIAADVTAPNYLLGTGDLSQYLSLLSRDPVSLGQYLQSAGSQAAQLVAVLAGAYGQPYNLDSWDGYGAAQRNFMGLLRQTNNAIVLSGDTHNAWGNQLIGDNATDFVGVELATPGVSAPGLEEYLTTTLAPLTATDPTILQTIGGVQVSNSPDFSLPNTRLPYLNLTDRGYLVVTITPDNVTSEWRFVPSVATALDNITLLQTNRAVVPAGSRRIELLP